MTITASIIDIAPPGQWSLGGLTFDAWLKLNRNTSLTITSHPIERGANISDHSYINPKRFSFEIGYTDVIESPIFGGTSNRSVNAYHALEDLQESREPLTLVDKYGVYENILIESIDVPDSFQTNKSVRATINLQQIIMAGINVVNVSNNIHATDFTNRGTISTPSINQQIIKAAVNWLGSLFK